MYRTIWLGSLVPVRTTTQDTWFGFTASFSVGAERKGNQQNMYVFAQKRFSRTIGVQVLLAMVGRAPSQDTGGHPHRLNFCRSSTLKTMSRTSSNRSSLNRNKMGSTCSKHSSKNSR